MIDYVLRRLTVRRRIIGGFLSLVLLLALSFPLVVTNYRFLIGRLQQVTDVEARTDRLLLLASARIASSRVNLMRYAQNYAPSPYEALDDVDQAIKLLRETQDLVTSPSQEASVMTVLEALADYKTLISDVEAARQQGASQEAVRLEFQAYKFGNDIGQRIEQAVKDSEARVAATNKDIYAEVQRRLITLIATWASVVILGVILALMITRSIIRPVTELQSGAEAFRQGHLDTTIPTTGADELSLLARVFNQMTGQLRDLVTSLEQRVVERTHDLEQRAVQLQAAADVGHAAASIRNLDELLPQVTHLISERFGFYHAGIFLLDEAGEYAVLRAANSEGGEKMLARGHRLKVGEVGIVGYVTGTGEPRIALDVGEDAVWFDNPDLPHTRSEMALPLVAGGRLLGALDVQSTEAAAFTEEDVSVLQMLADQVAVAIENARLFEELQTSLREINILYHRHSQAAWSRMATGDITAGYEYDRSQVAPIDHRLPPNMVARLQAGRVVILEAKGDGDGRNRSTLVAPIMLRGQVIGAIGFEEDTPNHQWSPEEVALIEAVTSQVALALENARLFEEAQARAGREHTIRQITEQMRRAVDVETILQTTVTQLGQAMDAPRVYVRLGTEAELEPSDGQCDDPQDYLFKREN